ncbi:MAG: hypothetical protein HY905_14855 [Deltaproteobacteria bacterium]|nr:hypothetical protein [Deltaproteobacteria bacterium]
MPKTKNKITLSSLPVVDLAYAVECLVAGGKTTTAEVLGLAADRGKRIALLEAELRELRGGVVASKTAKRRRPAARPVLAPAPKAAAARPPSSLNAFRKLQGKYMGLLRNFTGPLRERIKGIAKAQKFPAAIAEMKNLLAVKGAPAKTGRKTAPKTAPARKAAPMIVAPRKLTITPKRAAQLKLQGVYIGMIRSLPESVKARIKTIAKDKGFAAAIAVMKKAAK